MKTALFALNYEILVLQVRGPPFGHLTVMLGDSLCVRQTEEEKMLRQHSKLFGTFVGFAIMVALIWNPPSYLTAQEKDDKPKPKEKEEVIETRGEEAKKPKYTQKEEKNDPKAKGGEVTKRASATTCDVHIDNRTRLFIHRVYIDRRYYGSVPRLGDLYVYDVISGPTEIYAEADMTNGIRTWGPTRVSCPSFTTYTMRLQ